MEIITLKLDKESLNRCANSYARAMHNDDLHTYLFPQPIGREQKMISLFKFMIRSGDYDIYATADLEGVLILEKPCTHHTHVSLKEILFGVPMLFTIGVKTIRRMTAYRKQCNLIKDRLVSKPYRYLYLIFVSPEHQRKGFAGQLIRPIIEEARLKGECVYLETQNFQNVSIYQKYGFNLISSEKIAGSNLTHYSLCYGASIPPDEYHTNKC